ncbi:MAG TPA: GAF domain-containing protein [Actinomycetales bacterium]|jgi:GAF domain-containing protein
MKLIPESARVLADLSEVSGTDLAAELGVAAERLMAIVPSCVGLSLSGLHDSYTFTLVASDETIAGLDATQYLAGGPCVDAVADDERVESRDLQDPMDERRWELFARAGAASGVRSTLSFPLRDSGVVRGSVNLYAGVPRAFEGHEGEIASLFGAWSQDAVRNADLSWSTRTTAAGTPQRLEDQAEISQAVGVLLAREGIDAVTAQSRLAAAAARAGISELAVARVVLTLVLGEAAGR